MFAEIFIYSNSTLSGYFGEVSKCQIFKLSFRLRALVAQVGRAPSMLKKVVGRASDCG
jgi:hypothetical protein